MNLRTLLVLLIHSVMGELDRRVITSLKYSMYRVKTTIVNGEPATNDKVPYIVSIKEPQGMVTAQDVFWTNLCGGSIIGEQKVLTAAHCFEGSNYYYANNPHVLGVFAGTTKTSITHSGVTETREDLQVRRIKYVVLHRKFHFPSNDIALVFVNVPWNYTDSVNFIVPAKRDLENYYQCVASGYGRIGYGYGQPESDVLLVARIRPMSKWQCSTLWQMNMNTFVCTSSEVSDVARGDSGGPLACFDTGDPEEPPGKELLVGVVSGKNFDQTTLFTRVSAYHDWIERGGNLGCRLTPTVFTIIWIILIYLLFLLYSQLIAKRQWRISLKC
ncbi:hypothetical protein ABMA28_008468 [Loxostege sticticalis]|uniref:Peptidase S1 domain-containing protein n=1 Tax=Loxostege sticticalis TaxID=481309 RepID=A0ABD0SHA2_LOXSC